MVSNKIILVNKMNIKYTSILLILVFLVTSCNVVDSITRNDDGSDAVELYPIQLDGDWGFVDQDGSVRIEPKFQNASIFSNGLAKVRYQNSWKYINSKGEFVIEGDYWEIQDFSDGRAAVRIDGRWGYINKDGNFAVNPRFRSAYAFSDDRAFVRSLDYSRYYYITKDGTEIESVSIPDDMDFVEANIFRNGRALVNDDDLFGYIDTKGNTVVELKYPEARSFSDKLAAVKISDKWGYIDNSGNVSISPQFISAGDFGDGLAPARKSTNQFGYINRKGEFVIEEQFDDVRTFQEERAAVMIGDKWTFIDKSGNQITSPKFDEVEPFYNGLARVTIIIPVGAEFENRYGYINKKGSYVWFPTN